MLENVLGQLDYNILSTLKLNGFERNDIITDAWLKAYAAPFPSPESAAGAIGWAKGFATGMHEFVFGAHAAVASAVSWVPVTDYEFLEAHEVPQARLAFEQHRERLAVHRALRDRFVEELPADG